MTQKSRAFLDFYGEQAIIPTTQRIFNESDYGHRREHLFRQLGIPLGWLEGKTVFELGPGNGQKAAFLLSYQPDSYMAVDGNPTSVSETRKRLSTRPSDVSVEVIEADFLDFTCDRQFDLVIAEAVVPTQANPSAFLLRLCDVAKPGGVVVFTCMDEVSLLSEMLRRAIADQIVDPTQSLSIQAETLSAFFRQDLESLEGMTRIPEDWAIDQLIHPWIGPLLDIPTALAAIEARVEFLGSSPDFLQDWRWYKSPAVQKSSVDFATSAFWQSAHNLVDSRVILANRDPDLNRELFRAAKTLYERIIQRNYVSLGDLAELVGEVARNIPVEARPTLGAIAAFMDFARTGKIESLEPMRSWWGRGQQYVSVILRDI